MNQDERIKELESALERAIRYIHNDFEPDNQAMIYHDLKNILDNR